MPEIETKPEGEVETNPDANAEITTPETGSEAAEAGASTEAGAPTQEYSPEQYAEAVRAMNEAQRGQAEARQQAAVSRQQADYYQQMAQTAAGVVQQATDPKEAAWAAIAKAREDFDTQSERDAFERLQAIGQQAAVEQALKAQQINAQMPRAGEMLGVTDQNVLSQQLGQIHQTLTPQELSMVGLHRQGKLAEFITADQVKAEDAAKQAELLQSFTSGGGRSVPGSLEQRAEAPTHAEWNYDMYGEDVQKKLLEDGARVVDREGNDRTDFWRSKHGV